MRISVHPESRRLPVGQFIPSYPDHVIELSGLRGEVLAFQVQVEQGSDDQLAFAASDLSTGDDLKWAWAWENSIRVDPVRRFVPGRLGPGWYYDALMEVRDSDPYPARVCAFYVELTVPDTEAGVHTAELTIRSQSERKNVAVALTIHNATLRPSAMPFACGLNVARMSLAGESLPDVPGYVRMAREHGLDLLVRSWLWEPPWKSYDVLGPLIPDAKVWLLPTPIGYGCPFPNPTLDPLHAVSLIRDRWLMEGWPLDRLLLWVYDEPEIKSWVRLGEPQAYYQHIKASHPDIRVMVSTGETWGDQCCDVLASRGDRFTPREGVEQWVYQDYGVYLPLESIDTPLTNFRSWPWIAKAHPKIAGMLFWCANFWSDDPFVVPDGQPESYNDGQGVLVYPGCRASLRLKAIRRGMQDLALIEMAGDRQPLTVSAMLAQATGGYMGRPGTRITAPEWFDERAKQLRGIIA